MAISKQECKKIEEVLRASLRNKFRNYQPETSAMPFHTRLLGKDRLALYSFIHSLNTNFGSTIFEPVAKSIAQNNFKNVASCVKIGEQISSEAQVAIQRIIDNLSSGRAMPNKQNEIEAIRTVCQKGQIINVKPTRVDLSFETHNGELYLFDIKTAKPNAGSFKEFKRTLLEWVAVVLFKNPSTTINTLIAIPYNPYAPAPYARWTMRGMLETESELMVAEEFWDFLGGKNTYNDLLGCFERVGIELREEIDHYFKNFK